MSDQPPPSSFIHPAPESEIEISEQIVLFEGATSQLSPATNAGQKIPLAYRAVRGGWWLLGSAYWVTAFGFVVNILLTRLLSPEIYGTFALATFFYTLFNLRAKMSLNYAFAQHNKVDSASVGTLFYLDVAFGLIGFLLMLLSAPLLIEMGYAPAVLMIAIVLSAMAALESFLTVFGAVLDCELRFKPVSIIGSVVMPLSYVPAFWLATHQMGEYSLVAQSITFTGLSLLAGGGYAVWRMRHIMSLRWRFQRTLAERFLRFGVLTGTGLFVAGIVTQVDNFMVGTVTGTKPLGYYDRAYRTAQWPSLLVSSVLARSALFTYTNLQGDRDRLSKTFDMVYWITVSLVLPLALVLFVTASDLILWLYGEQWMPSVPLLRLLLVISVTRPLWENVGTFFVGVGLPRNIIFISTLQLVILVAAGWPLVQMFGAVGMAVAAGGTMLISLGYTLFLARKSIDIDFFSVLGTPALAAILVLIGYWLLNSLLPIEALSLAGRVLTNAVFAFGAYWVAVFAIRPRDTTRRVQYLIRLTRAHS